MVSANSSAMQDFVSRFNTVSEMRRLSFLFLLFCTFVLSSCRKEEPIAENGTPVFSAQGTLGASQLDLVAGRNDYYMYSSYSSDAQNIYELKGELKKRDCASPCPLSLTVRIRDYATHASQQTLVDSTLHIGNYSFVTSASSYTVNFTSLAQGDTSMTYFWDFGDSTTSTLQNPSHTYSGPGPYAVTFVATGNSFFSTDSITDIISPGTTPCMNVGFSTASLGPDSIQFTSSINGGVSPYTYLWDYGDGNFGFNDSVAHNYSSPGVYAVHLTVTDANGCTVSDYQRVRTASTSNTVSNFSWQVQSQTNPDFSKVIVEWVDANGNLYTSADPQQPVTSSFQLISSEEYQPNENGQPTKKVHLLVSCILYNGNNTLQLQNADLVFAFAYP